MLGVAVWVKLHVSPNLKVCGRRSKNSQHFFLFYYFVFWAEGLEKNELLKRKTVQLSMTSHCQGNAGKRDQHWTTIMSKKRKSSFFLGFGVSRPSRDKPPTITVPQSRCEVSEDTTEAQTQRTLDVIRPAQEDRWAPLIGGALHAGRVWSGPGGVSDSHCHDSSVHRSCDSTCLFVWSHSLLHRHRQKAKSCTKKYFAMLMLRSGSLVEGGKDFLAFDKVNYPAFSLTQHLNGLHTFVPTNFLSGRSMHGCGCPSLVCHYLLHPPCHPGQPSTTLMMTSELEANTSSVSNVCVCWMAPYLWHSQYSLLFFLFPIPRLFVFLNLTLPLSNSWHHWSEGRLGATWEDTRLWMMKWEVEGVNTQITDFKHR